MADEFLVSKSRRNTMSKVSKKVKAIAFCRDAEVKDKQVDVSFEDQKKYIEKYAEEHNFVIVKWFIQQGNGVGRKNEAALEKAHEFILDYNCYMWNGHFPDDLLTSEQEDEIKAIASNPALLPGDIKNLIVLSDYNAFLSIVSYYYWENALGTAGVKVVFTDHMLEMDTHYMEIDEMNYRWWAALSSSQKAKEIKQQKMSQKEIQELENPKYGL